MPKISIKKEHRIALDALFSEKDGLTVKTWDALRDLRDRIVNAYDADPPPKTAHLGPGLYLELLEQNLPGMYSLPPESSRTPSWYAKLGYMLGNTGLTEEALVQLCSYIKGWAKVPISAETIINKSATWLAHAESKRSAKSKGPADTIEDEGLF